MSLPTIISRIFEPIIILPVFVIALSASFSGLPGRELAKFYAFFFFGLFAPVAVFRLWLLKKKGVAWDIPKRRDRLAPLAALCGFFLVGYFGIRAWNDPFLSYLFGLLFLWFIGFFLLTFLTKISGHVAVAAVAAFLWVRWFGVYWWPVLGVIPLVAWARVAGKYHTVVEVIVGAAYTALVFGFYDTWQSIF